MRLFGGCRIVGEQNMPRPSRRVPRTLGGYPVKARGSGWGVGCEVSNLSRSESRFVRRWLDLTRAYSFCS